MSKDSRVLMALAESLDVEGTLKELGVDADDLRAVLVKAAQMLSREEGSAEGAEFVVYTDGASRGNPGPAGAGFVIYRDGRMVEGEAKYLGKITNNRAEYKALILALERAFDLGARKVRARTDSELLARQLQGVYRVKNKGLAKLFDRVQELIQGLDSFEIEHVGRELNTRADSLANRAIDEFQDEPGH